MPEAVTKAKLFEAEIRYDPETGMWSAWFPDSYHVRHGQLVCLAQSTDPFELSQRVSMIGRNHLAHLHDEQMDEAMLEIARTVPYPQDCQCQAYPRLRANDCHAHEDNPMHYLGHLEFECTCP